MLRIGVGLLLWFSMSSYGAAPNVAFFYGPNPPWDELRAYDIVVVEPAHGTDPKVASTAGTQIFAYLSVGEIEYDRPYAQDIPKGAIGGVNTPWRAHVIDQTHPEWPRFFLDRVVAPLWNAGYRGFFLDTLDSFQLIAKTDEERARQVQGLVGVIRAMRKQYPEAKLVFNRGFEILPELHRDVYAIAVESLYRGWNQGSREYVEVSEADRGWLMPHLQRASKEYKLPVIAIEYVPPGQRELARETARRVAQLGFTPWVTNSDLDHLGIGNIEVMPRKILMLYDGSGNEFNLYADRIHRAATMPLNYLGYTAEYVDVSGPLPQQSLIGRYAGIVSWFPNDQVGRKNPALREWLARQRADGMRIAVLGSFGFPLLDGAVRSFGLDASPPKGPAQKLSVDFRDPLVGFEIQPLPDRGLFTPLRATEGTVLLRMRSDAGDTMDAAALTSWGGYVLEPYELIELPVVGSNRWVINPIEFLRRALALPAMPVPDVTTENGRRLMLVHIDGDGLVNRAEMRGAPFAGEVLLREIIERYRVPHTVSIIQGETAANGLFPKESPELENIARRIFALPHVEIASHTFSHPFSWRPTQPAAPPGTYNLDIKGYKLDLDTEIAGSIEYINSQLAPAGKRARLLLWTGDTNPGRDALAAAQRAGVLNMNGGGASTTRRDPTLSQVWPIGMRKGAYFQVHAPNHSENVYTNLWTGPFYGYERAIETFELTNEPYRLKPINIYYHFYSASKRASITALHRVYEWALRQPVMNIYASEYVDKVLDFNRMTVARGPDGWVVRGGAALREVRIPAALGTPDIGASDAVAGFVTHGNERYLHLAGDAAVIRLSAKPPVQPYVVDANGRIERFERKGGSTQFTLRAHVPLRFALANVSGCRVDGDGRPLSGVTQGGVTRYELKQNAIERLSITCA